MNILNLLAILAGTPQWSTTCVMTQADQLQGYTIDSVQFQKASPSSANELNVSFTRTWYEDDQCKQATGVTNTTAGQVTLENLISENVFAADWKINHTTQLGAIGISSDGKSIRLATTSFGNSRNTMLSLFQYFAIPTSPHGNE